MLKAEYGYKFGNFDPEKHSIFRVDGPMNSRKELKKRQTPGSENGFPFGTKCEFSPGGTNCAVHYAPKNMCSGVVQPYSLEEAVAFINSGGKVGSNV